jgi:Patatin-like phospholipase
VDKILQGQIPDEDDCCRFDHTILEAFLKCLVKAHLKSKDCSMFEATAKAEHQVCPTFVVAKMAKHVDGTAFIFRSYSGKGLHPSHSPIWQAARATSAAPSYFKEMFISTPLPGIAYVDGGIGHNNPAEIALQDEAPKIWPTCRQFCLVSIGTGQHSALKIQSISDHDIVEQFKEFIPSICASSLFMHSTSSYSPGVLALINMARTMSELVSDSQNVHRRLYRISASADLDKCFPYFRFNVERNIGDIGFQDWAKEEEIGTYTTSYLQEYEIERFRIECVRCLVDPPEFKRKSNKQLSVILIDRHQDI